jgi:methylmalonyl-CoA mutase cobalamin-binding subunit
MHELAWFKDMPEGQPATSAVGLDDLLDRFARWLIYQLRSWPDDARRLAVATARFLEDSEVLNPAARRQRPLGRGFEELLDERLRRRFALVPQSMVLLAALRGNFQLLMEDPDQGVAKIEHDLGAPLTADDLDWIEVERRAGMLRFVRHNKTEGGHIRWLLRKDHQHRVVLDRFGVRGHWIICHDGSSIATAKLGTAVERTMLAHEQMMGRGWRLITAGALDEPASGEYPGFAIDAAYRLADLPEPVTATALRNYVRQNAAVVGSGDVRKVVPAALTRPEKPHPRLAPGRDFTLLSTTDEVILRQQSTAGTTVLARIPHSPDDDGLLGFLESVECIADLAMPLDEMGQHRQDSDAVGWTRALLRCLAQPAKGRSPAKSTVRLVYVPAAIEHQLGGVPLIGLEFLRDRLERAGARVNILNIPPADFARRAPELLGADVIGIGVYIHNYSDVAQLVRRLREAGYMGRIVLGGPQLRDIELIQESVEGWDALIRGEAEDVLPQVLETFAHLDAGRWEEALELARTMSGVAIRHGKAVMLCETAFRNRAAEIACPLPFDWGRSKSGRKLQMNFTRGCPYLCTFCPNHQGQRYRSGAVDELWRFTVLAVADDLPLPVGAEEATARLIQDLLGVTGTTRIRVALHVLLRMGCDADQFRALIAPIARLADPAVRADRAELGSLLGMGDTLDDQEPSHADGPMSAWQLKKAWLTAKVALLASRQLWKRAARQPESLREMERRARPAFVLATSEDNTLVNKVVIREYLRRRIEYGLDSDIIFNPGQNTIWDLTDKNGGVDEDYVSDLVLRNPFAVALGVDGSSNPVIRQNRKPRYGIGDAMAVNRALACRGVVVANNYILLTAETDLLEAVEAFALYLLLPLPWRDYGQSVNLRVIKEEGTLAHDEGLIFAPRDTGWHEPLRFPKVAELLDRWELTSEIASSDLEPLLWRILREDRAAADLLPLIVERWLCDFDSDPEVRAIAQRISAASRPGMPLVDTLQAVQRQLSEEFPGKAGDR